MISFGSVCSGIESASVALEPMGFTPAWFSEVEPFPSAVLAHHWPHVQNYGDMLNIRHMLNRGQLTLELIKIADSIDEQRKRDGKKESVLWWENVPGVLNTRGNAFGCFLGELAGEDEALVPPRGKWSNAGYVLGPKRAIAWRVIDAQYFGVAQRRRRVFVVASARNELDPRKVLFESEGVRRDTPPSRETHKETTRPATASLRTGYRMAAFGEYSSDETASTMKSRDYKDATDLVVHGARPPCASPGLRVRRLTPLECERLQGFPDGHTRIPYRNKPAEECPDGPRYKAVGNSKAVPCVRWIGSRLLVELLS